MSFFDGITINATFILFPMGIYLLCVAYNNNLGKNTNKVFLDLANFSALYFLIRYSIMFNLECSLLFINIPFLISILNKRKISSFIMAIIICVYYTQVFNFMPYIPIIEYSTYLLILSLFDKKSFNYTTIINIFIIFKGITLTIYNLYIIPSVSSIYPILVSVFFNLIIFYFLAILIFYALKRGEEVISLNSVLKQLEKEKLLKNSLFKITHELKNPIAVCKGYLSMIDYDDTKKAIKYNEIIKNEIDRTLDIMDNFSSYTKINIKKEVMDMVSLIEDTLSAMEMLFKEQDIKINSCISDDELFINGDYNRLKQVLINILKNASEAMNEKGIIEIKLKDIKNKIVLTIKDNGCGMNKEDLKKLTELFYSTKEKGYGIGVPLSFEIIRQHDGEMKYESKKGIGTKVTIELQKYKY